MTDQLAQQIVAHYEQHAAEWDRERQNTQWNDRIWHDRFIGRLRSGAKVLDLGCGSGRRVGEHMAKQGLRVLALSSETEVLWNLNPIRSDMRGFHRSSDARTHRHDAVDHRRLRSSGGKRGWKDSWRCDGDANRSSGYCAALRHLCRSTVLEMWHRPC